MRCYVWQRQIATGLRVGERMANTKTAERAVTRAVDAPRALFTWPLSVQLLVALPLAAIPRLWAAVADHSLIWPDEVFQVTEPAHRLAFGVGFLSWEYDLGYRSWLLPGVLSGYLRALDVVGLDSGLALMTSARVLFALLALGAVAAAMALAWRVGGATASVLAGALTVTFPMLLVFSHHTFAENVAAPLVVVAAALLVVPRPSRVAALLAGAAAATAVAVRPQTAIVLLGLGVILALRRDWRALLDVTITSAGVALVALVVDWATWGTPFISYWRYLDYNLAESGEVYGRSPWDYYLTTMWSANGVLVLVVLAGLAFALRRVPGLVAVVAAYVALHAVIEHKELRFLLPIVPLALAVAAIGWADVADRAYRHWSPSGRPSPAARRLRIGVLVAVAAVPIAFARTAADTTFGTLGETRFTAADTSPWGHLEGWNRLASRAGDEPDLCGLATTLVPIFSGGYSYLRRDVPMFGIDIREITERATIPDGANYVIADARLPLARGYRVVDTAGGFTLARRTGGCGPPPDWYTRTLVR